MPVVEIGLEVVALRPLVPGLDEEQPMVRRAMASESTAALT